VKTQQFITDFVAPSWRGPVMRSLIALGCLAALPATARADVTVDSAVTGPVSGDGGTFTVTPSGTITSSGTAVLAQAGNAITTLTVQGVVEGGSAGVGVMSNTIVTSLLNSGTISGSGSGVGRYGVNVVRLGSDVGKIESLVNQSGGLIAGTGDAAGIGGDGRYDSIENYGTIQAQRNAIVLTGTSGSITNRAGGVVRATSTDVHAVFLMAPLDTLTNDAGGVIESSSDIAIRTITPGRLTTLTNAGEIRGSTGLRNSAAINSLSNSGTFSGTVYGINKSGTIATLTNEATGLIHGDNSGLYTNSYALMDATNAGRITGGTNGVHGYYGFRQPFTNLTGGVISGTANAGLLVEDDAVLITNQAGGVIESAQGTGAKFVNFNATTNELVNAGQISGATAGIHVDTYLLRKLTNTGTVSYTGTGTGPAVRVGPSGTLGVASGTSGVALTSTGAGALLAGTIENRGTIHYGFTVENQNVTVSAGGGTGTFTNGTLDVADGNLLFTSGVLALDADVSVDGGEGLFTNEATLALGDAQTVTGNFAQSSVGTFRSVISGLSAYGNLDINGTALFAGGLDLSLSSFALAEGQTFNLFLFETYEGEFSGLSVDGVALVSAGDNQWTYGDFTLQEVWTPTSMSISVVPEPSTFALGAAGLACAAWLRHRRRRAAGPQA